MDPLNQVDAMHLQESRSSVLDLSVGCRQRPLKTTSMEALDLVKKSSWHGINLGSNNKTINMSEPWSDRCITQPSIPCPPVHPEPASQDHESGASGMPSHKPYSIPSQLVNGQPSVPHILPQYPPADHVFVDDDDYCVEMDDVLTQTKKLCKKADSVLENGTFGDRIEHSGLKTHLQNILTNCGEMYLSDTLSVMSQTKDSSQLPQDTDAPVKILESECTGAKETSPCSVQSISSDDDSDIADVPVTNSRCKTPPNCHFQFRRVIVNETCHGNKSTDFAKQDIDSDGQMDRYPENVNNPYLLGKSDCEACEVRDGSEPKSLLAWMESVMIPINLQDNDRDMDSALYKPFPSTLDAENTNILKSSLSGPLSSTSRQPQKTPASKSRKRSKPRPRQKKPPKQVRVSSGNKSSARTPKRRRRKPRSSGTLSLFSPQEPEIKLKYANHKEDKRDAKMESFAPYIHMEFSSCTVVNFWEKDDFAAKKGQQQTVSGVIPNSSCLRLGRVALDSRFQVRHFCCLCGRAANDEGLGDLHGPYCPSGAQAICKDDSSPPAQRLDPECSDLDSVYSLEDGGPQFVKGTDVLLVSYKQQRKVNCVEKVEEPDVYHERWIHEDCIIWTAGVFLVKGKLYGLEEAIQLAQGTVCSYCHRVGATLGCFFKDCSSKYHFLCALQSDCALNEENFTIRCLKHKYKSSRMSVSRLKSR